MQRTRCPFRRIYPATHHVRITAQLDADRGLVVPDQTGDLRDAELSCHKVGYLVSFMFN